MKSTRKIVGMNINGITMQGRGSQTFSNRELFLKVFQLLRDALKHSFALKKCLNLLKKN